MYLETLIPYLIEPFSYIYFILELVTPNLTLISFSACCSYFDYIRKRDRDKERERKEEMERDRERAREKKKELERERKREGER